MRKQSNVLIFAALCAAISIAGCGTSPPPPARNGGQESRAAPAKAEGRKSAPSAPGRGVSR